MIPGFGEPYPVRDAIVKESRKPTDILVRWEEQSLLQRVNQTPFRVFVVPELQVDGNDSGTLAGDQVAGLFRITMYAEVVTADPVSSSLTVTIGFTHNGKPLTRAMVFAGAPQTVSDQTGTVMVIETDPGTSISYTLTYASNTPGLAVYSLTMASELVNAQE